MGIGSHQVSCDARNNAVNASGVTATSPTATLDLSIRQPTASAITFARIADALKCQTAIERVKVAGRVRTVRRHGKRVRVRGPAANRPPAGAQVPRPDGGANRAGWS